MWELVWKARQHHVFLSANAAPCVAYVELNELPSPVICKPVSNLRKAGGEDAGWCGSRDSAQTGHWKPLPRGMHHWQSVSFSQCGVLPFEIKEREQIFDLEIKTIFRKKYLAAKGIISTAGREIPSVCAL